MSRLPAIQQALISRGTFFNTGTDRTSWLWVVAAALLTALLVPTHAPFPYQYRVGQPWSYPTLRAPFDFDVLRPEAEARPEIQRIEAEHAPYFVLDPEIGRKQKRRFAALLAEQLTNGAHDVQWDDVRANAVTYEGYGQELLDRLYERGIIFSQDERLLNLPADSAVYVVRGRDERRVPVGALLNVEKARLYISDTLPYSPLRQPELILPLLEKVLVPNLLYNDSITRVSKRLKLAAAQSTGISVHKGDVLVERGDVVGDEERQQLESLARRYELPHGPAVLAGYFVLALLAFAGLFIWLNAEPAYSQHAAAHFRLFAGLVVPALLYVNLANRFAAPLPLLLPLWLVPLLLRSRYGLRGATGVGLVLVFVTMLALTWSAAWFALQLAGATLALALYPQAEGWTARARAAGVIALVQLMAWLGCWWAEKLPDSLKTYDVGLFLAGGALLSLGVLFFLEQRKAAYGGE